MKKLMLLAAMLAMVLVAAAPAFAQDQTSGDATGGDVAIANELGNQCVQIINQQNTGNVQQEQEVEQNLTQINTIMASLNIQNVTGDVNAEQNIDQTVTQEGIEQIVNAEQNCEQALAVVQGEGEAKAEVKAEEKKAEAKAGEMKKEEKKEEKKMLPATGGASLFALGAGALLVTGGLVARRIIK